MKLEDYIHSHLIVKVGITPSEYICSETVVDKPYELISVVKQNKCYISCVRWWDRVEITLGSKIGYGGPRDPRAPNDYFFSETDICRKFDAFTKKDEYYEYLNEIKNTYKSYDLYPAFDIKRNTADRINTADGTVCSDES